ncbi:3'-5' exonuclease [Anaerocolumna sedimenticola]|uniref:3'-5' exonuclease n=1 Tax=Anaerocolumna sedimenticola TaxID=2696063 RepID=A0A6P1TH74_9FIRM|nr:3'-5' exonuclease [Anaerocolumna sedimenticola]QHQ60504.1 3'-5' exonuclease [Anaerocolumna sedimenticola]
MDDKIQNERITSFVCFDVETTGLNPEKDKIIEIGALKVKEGKIIGKFTEFINPKMKLPGHITKLTGITDEMIQYSETEDTVVCRFLEFAGDYIIMGHNIGFDYSFLKTAAVRQHKTFEKMGIDTLSLCRKLLPDMESKSLGSMCRHYQIINENAHRAYDDAKATAMLYVKLCNEFYLKRPEIFLPKPLWFKIKKNRPITNKQKNYLIDLLKYHKIESEQSIDFLTQSEASRMIDKIILEKGRII